MSLRQSVRTILALTALIFVKFVKLTFSLKSVEKILDLFKIEQITSRIDKYVYTV